MGCELGRNQERGWKEVELAQLSIVLGNDAIPCQLPLTRRVSLLLCRQCRSGCLRGQSRRFATQWLLPFISWWLQCQYWVWIFDILLFLNILNIFLKNVEHSPAHIDRCWPGRVVGGRVVSQYGKNGACFGTGIPVVGIRLRLGNWMIDFENYNPLPSPRIHPSHLSGQFGAPVTSLEVRSLCRHCPAPPCRPPSSLTRPLCCRWSG
jgi:hypothetical protein